MLLKPDQILDIVHGTLFTSVSPEGETRFYRFSSKQQKAYADRSESFGLKCYASSGVMLDFITDSDTLSFTAELSKATTNELSAIDLLIDGGIFQTVRFDDYGIKKIGFTLPMGEHRITVVLPWNSVTVLRDIALSDGAYILPVEKAVRILALGDSITQGYTASYPSASYVSRYTLALNAEVLNQGIGGYKFYEESIDEELGWQPDIITLAYGTNDYSVNDSFSDFINYAETYIEKLTRAFPDTPILGITPIFCGEEKRKIKEQTKDYTFEDAIQKLDEIYARYPQIKVLDGISFYPHPIDFFMPDWLHPNDIGFSYYAEAVIKALKEML
ncbi:MAG: SGNH/GDSL hydrolase family protein [Clostridia bacterium]|nr:SGNH/GDSL hydrolase family protein [Clostridia bacterium]